jgi:dihydrofolate reductase
MRKLKLQMQISIDGFVAGPNHEMDWMEFNWDEKLTAFVQGLTDSFDTILLGKNLASGFIPHWTGVLDSPENPEFSAAQTFVNTPKVVFSKTLTESIWANTELAKGDFIKEINRLKSLPGRDIIVYGGATFVRSLVEARLIDDLYLFINPTAIGEGLPIFSEKTSMKLINSTAFEGGIVVNHYQFL